MITVTRIEPELQADYMDSIQYYWNQMLTCKRQIRYLQEHPMIPFRLVRVAKLREIMRSAELNIAFFTRLYCGDDFFGTTSRRLGLDTSCFIVHI